MKKQTQKPAAATTKARRTSLHAKGQPRRLHCLPAAEIQLAPMDFDEPLTDEELALFVALDTRTQTRRKKLLIDPAESARFFARDAQEWNQSGHFPLTTLRFNEIARWLAAKSGANFLPFPAVPGSEVRA